jgi:hypothetical protein
MDAQQLIEQCLGNDIHLEVVSLDKLRCRYPSGTLQDDLQSQLRELKPQIIKCLLSLKPYKFVYRVEVDGKTSTVLSLQYADQFRRSLERKFGTGRVGEIKVTHLRLIAKAQ